MRHRWLAPLLAVVIAIAAVITLKPAAEQDERSKASAAAVVADARNVGFSMDGGLLGAPIASRNADLDRVKAVGATWVRLSFNWVTLEMHGKGRYNWGPADQLVAAANARGLKINAVVAYTPSWARPAGTSGVHPPTRLADYSDFLRAAAKRYAPMGVHTWEIWNEPNLHTMWAPKPDVTKYTAMLRLAYPAIKASDPTATVITGGMSPAYDAADGSQVLPMTWVKGMYARGAKGYFDAIGHHPSSFPHSSNLIASWNPFQQSKTIYSYMQSQGDGAKKIWATEIAFPTGTHSEAVSETLQGERYAESLESWQAFSFGGPIFIYSLRDTGTNTNSRYEMSGVYRHNGAPKASVNRIKQVLHAPQRVKATASGSSVKVTWEAPGYDYGMSITGYFVTATPGGTTVTVPSSARSAIVNPPAGTYRFVVKPSFSGWPGYASLPSNAVTPNVPSVYPTTGTVTEGDSGTTTLRVPVYLNKASTQTVTVDYTTATVLPLYAAAVPNDYDTATGSITFAPGETVKQISVTVKGDTHLEPGADEFLVVLSNPTNANIGGFGGLGVGRILDDD
jgi:hypothetical protein